MGLFCTKNKRTKMNCIERCYIYTEIKNSERLQKFSSESLLGSAVLSPFIQPCPIYARYMCLLIFSEKSKIICKVRH